MSINKVDVVENEEKKKAFVRLNVLDSNGLPQKAFDDFFQLIGDVFKTH